MQAAKNALYVVYGEEAVNRTLEYYQLDKETVISGRDFSALITGIVTNLTYEDLRVIYILAKDTNFDELTEKELCDALQQIRDVNCEIKPLKNASYVRQLLHDQVVLKCFSEVDEYNAFSDEVPTADLKKFSYTEFLGRELAYGLFDHESSKFPDGILFSMYDKEGKQSLKEAHTLVSDKGLHGAVIRPAKLTTEQNMADIQVVYRGTYCMNSLLRDFSPYERTKTRFFEGPGRVSFMTHQDEIANSIFRHVNQVAGDSQNRKVDVEFLGHSLGGSDAQRTLEYFLHRLVEVKNFSVGGLNLSVYNSPCVESDIANRFIENVGKVQNRLQLRYFHVHHDPVQELGVKKLGFCGHGMKTPKDLSISIFKFNRNVIERLLAQVENVYRRNKKLLWMNKDAHSSCCLRLHDRNDRNKLNTTFIQDVFTNNLEDLQCRYGESAGNVLEHPADQELMDENLITFSCRIGRSLKRKSDNLRKELPVFARLYQELELKI